MIRLALIFVIFVLGYAFMSALMYEFGVMGTIFVLMAFWVVSTDQSNNERGKHERQGK